MSIAFYPALGLITYGSDAASTKAPLVAVPAQKSNDGDLEVKACFIKSRTIRKCLSLMHVFKIARLQVIEFVHFQPND